VKKWDEELKLILTIRDIKLGEIIEMRIAKIRISYIYGYIEKVQTIKFD
jgi:hypothetical protein